MIYEGYTISWNSDNPKVVTCESEDITDLFLKREHAELSCSLHTARRRNHEDTTMKIALWDTMITIMDERGIEV